MLWTRAWIQSSALCNVNNTLLNLMLHINTVYTVLVNALFFSLGKFVFKACTRSCLIGNTWKYGTLFILNTDILFLYYFKLKNKTVLPALYLCLQSQIYLLLVRNVQFVSIQISPQRTWNISAVTSASTCHVLFYCSGRNST